MKNTHIFSKVLLVLLTLAFTAFLALAVSRAPASAGMGFMKRGDDEQSDRAKNRDDRQAREDRDRQDRGRQDRDRQERDRQSQAERERQGDRDRQAREDRDREDRGRQVRADRERQDREVRDRENGERQARSDRERQERDRQAQAERERQADRDRQAREGRDREDRGRQARADRERQDREVRDRENGERQARADRERQERDRQAKVERERQADRDRAAQREKDRASWQASTVKPRRGDSDSGASSARRDGKSGGSGDSRSNRPQRSGYERPKADDSRTDVRVEDRRERGDSGRSGVGGIFGKSKRGESDRDESSRVENRPSGSGSTRTGEVYRSTPSSSNRPKRTDQVARPSISTSGRSWSGQRTDRVFTRVYETRRDWRVRYHSYDYRHRPSFHGGFYYYGSSRYDPYYYGYYCFSYVPRYTYPSLYFYYGTFPYMYRDRIVFISFPFRRYVYVPLYVYGDDFYRPYYQPYPGYYLSTSNRREMRNTLDDIQEAWERADYDLIMRHVRYSERVHVYFKDQYEYSVDFDDYRDMTRDAMETIDTIGFEFYKVSMRYRDEVVAYGRHKYYDDDDKYSVVNVTYTLERRGGEWYITEVGSSPRSTSRL